MKCTIETLKQNKYALNTTADTPGKNINARVNLWLTPILSNCLSITDTIKQIKNLEATSFFYIR